MKKLKIAAGICAVVCIISIAKLSMADSDYRNLDIQPLNATQASATLSPVDGSQVTPMETTYSSVDSYRIEATSGQ